MIPFSILDLAPVPQGHTVADALRNTLDLAQHAEHWGYRRFWLAEHHGMPGIASAATAVVIGHVGAGTKTIRIGAGGIMLPNHSPLVIAEQFGTLESLFPGRIDLGLGRAPGTDPATAHALRRTLEGDVDSFPQDVVELAGYFGPDEPGQRVRAVPGAGLKVPLWILGSSTYGAQLAAMLGLPYAFASHFAPAQMMDAIATYRRLFRPSGHIERPYVMLGFNVFAAETDEEAQLLATSMQQAVINLRRGNPGLLQPPDPTLEASLTPHDKAILSSFLAASAIGSPETVRSAVADFIARTGADELIVASQIHDHAARLRSYAILAGVRDSLAAESAGAAA
ncbi:MAG: LLM class flavin-dependent oxidoreductase [Bauldia sp.]|nr:LLM class flavin-dependent oxidoreductase [Bauldia sp.]MCW5718943.1 LLM class flavin-dependent oxidoreductase [Bauldia sp.]